MHSINPATQKLGTVRNMNETSKAMRRRYVEDKTGVFPWWEVFQGEGLDIGSGPDKLFFPGCKSFDLEDGDANYLLNHIAPESLDYLHSSQCLEHMIDPYYAFDGWIGAVKPGGHLIVTVPDWCLYERMIWPSRFNPDHKSAWSMWLKDSNAPIHVYVPQFLANYHFAVDVKLCRVIDTNYRYKENPELDQTWIESHGVEAFIEFVLQKLP